MVLCNNDHEHTSIFIMQPLDSDLNHITEKFSYTHDLILLKVKIIQQVWYEIIFWVSGNKVFVSGIHKLNRDFTPTIGLIPF